MSEQPGNSGQEVRDHRSAGDGGQPLDASMLGQELQDRDIHIRMDSSQGNLVISIPVPSNSGDSGAVCTSAGEPQSAEFVVTVSLSAPNSRATRQSGVDGTTQEAHTLAADAGGVDDAVDRRKTIRVRVSVADDETNSANELRARSERAISELDTPAFEETYERLGPRRVRLVWDDVDGAESYDLSYYVNRDSEWVRLPAPGIAVTYDGAGALVDGLPEGVLWFFKVRAAAGAIESEWSNILIVWPTKAGD